MDGKKLVGFGLIIIILVVGVFAWKNSSVISAKADITSIKYEMSLMKAKIKEDNPDASAKTRAEKLKDKIEDEELDEDLKDAERELKEEQVDQLSGTWCLKMIQWIGLLVTGLGLMMVLNSGSDYERLGALIAIGLLFFSLRTFIA